MKVTKTAIKRKLYEVLDPELSISIVDLGLIYDIKIEKSRVKIIMTLTTAGCPLISMIENEIKNKLKEIGLKEKEIDIDLTFEPPWSMEMMSERAKTMLGIS
ncbi:MAG: metal-sulfur cluster assembly factor [Candidatus Roizmanbacteria bacterium]